MEVILNFVLTSIVHGELRSSISAIAHFSLCAQLGTNLLDNTGLPWACDFEVISATDSNEAGSQLAA